MSDRRIVKTLISIIAIFLICLNASHASDIHIAVQQGDLSAVKRALADDSSAYAAVWQKGNNKALALDNISTKGLHHIEARDEWVPDPKNAPIQLVGFDGEVKEIVGSTRLLMECVNRADAYLEEVRAQMEEMYDIAAAAVRKRRTVDDDDDDDDDGLIIA